MSDSIFLFGFGMLADLKLFKWVSRWVSLAGFSGNLVRGLRY